MNEEMPAVFVLELSAWNPDSPRFLMALLNAGLIITMESGCRVERRKLVGELLPPPEMFTSMPQEIQHKVMHSVKLSIAILEQAEWLVSLGTKLLLTVKGRVAASESRAAVRFLMEAIS